MIHFGSRTIFRYNERDARARASLSLQRQHTNTPITALELALFIIIVLLAAWLRFNYLSQAELLWDQAEISRWAMRMAGRGASPWQWRFAWIGPQSSTGLDTFPGAIWLMAIPYAISPSPVFATGFVAAINLLTVITCYFLTRRWFGREAALVATLLFAVAPWAVIYSRKIWHVELLPPLVIIYAIMGWHAFVQGRRWALIAHVLALAALVQTHFSTYPFVALTILWALIFYRRIDWKLVPLAALLGALTFAPYFIVDAQNGWENIQRLWGILQKPTLMSADAARSAWLITTGWDLQRITGPDRYPDFVATTPNLRWLFAAEGGLAILGILAATGQAIRQARAGLDEEAASALMAATWLALPILILTRHKTLVAPHYFTITFPAQFILIGWMMGKLWRSIQRSAWIARAPMLALVIALAITQAYETIAVLRFVRTHDTPWGRGTPLSYEIRAVETTERLREEMESAPEETEVILLSQGDEPRKYEMPAAADVLMPATPHRAADIRTTLIFPADPAVYWATYDMTYSERLLADLTSELTDERISLREGARSYRFYTWPGGEPSFAKLGAQTLRDEKVIPQLDGPPTWSNGAQLLGYRLEGHLRPEKIRWTLIWRATRALPWAKTMGRPGEDAYYHWFNHLLDEEGQMQGQKDGPSLLPAYWRAGDTVLNWFDLQISPDALPGTYTMRVGMYTYPELKNVPICKSQVAGCEPGEEERILIKIGRIEE